VVKFVGDGCLAVFEPTDAVRAIDAADALRSRVRELGSAHDVELDLGANIHLSTVAEGEFGSARIHDVVGMGVVHTFRMGSGAGTRISEPVYRKLPSERRSPWHKHQPPATYTQER
jgi:class 3 adenylate cyclase